MVLVGAGRLRGGDRGGRRARRVRPGGDRGARYADRPADHDHAPASTPPVHHHRGDRARGLDDVLRRHDDHRARGAGLPAARPVLVALRPHHHHDDATEHHHDHSSADHPAASTTADDDHDPAADHHDHRAADDDHDRAADHHDDRSAHDDHHGSAPGVT